MIPRAILDLAQLDDDHLFEELARGMRLCLTNALQLWRDAKLLSKRRRAQGFQIVKLLVEEEAAKFHILLDAARCPRNPPGRFSSHLKGFTDHLARGLYTEYYAWTQMPLSDAVTYLDRERQTLYLDGPEGVDWIFRNAIECRREEAIYVDYIAIRDHFRDEHEWRCPNPRLLDMYRLNSTPSVLHVAKALWHTGLSSPGGIRIVAQLWRDAAPPETQTWEQIRELNLQTLGRLQEANLTHATQATQRIMVNEWRPPLYPLNLKKLEVDAVALRAAQEQWVPDYY